MTARPHFHPWTSGSLRGFAVEGYDALRPLDLPWPEAQQKKPLPEGFRLAKRSKSRWVLATEVGGETLYFKREIHENWRRRVSALVLGPKTRREWAIAWKFLALGVHVPVPVLFAEDGAQAFLVTRGMPTTWTTVQDRVAALPDRRIESMALAGSYAGALHARRAYHHDYRNNHVYVTDAPESAPILERMALIDLDGATTGRAVGPARAEEAAVEFFRSFTRGTVTPEDVSAYATAYAVDSGRRLDAHRIASIVAASKPSQRKRKSPPTSSSSSSSSQ